MAIFAILANLTECKTIIDLKSIKLIKNSIENITICKQTYLNFYNWISQYLINTVKNLPADIEIEMKLTVTYKEIIILLI